MTNLRSHDLIARPGSIFSVVTKMSLPEVTVIMPVYNGASFLEEAIDSVLGQTFPDFELLAMNDGSTDRTNEILARYRDSRLRVVHNSKNIGLIATLNKGLDLAKGKFIARADADDISRPKRLQAQLAFLRKHPCVGICGTWFRTFGEVQSRIVRPPTVPAHVTAHAFFQCPIAHPSVMLRTSFFKKFSLYYDPSAMHAEDYELWVRASRHFALANVPHVLLDYRVHAEQISAKGNREQVNTSRRIRLRQLLNLYPEATLDQQEWHLKMCEGSIPINLASMLRMRDWLDELWKRNNERKSFERMAFGVALGRMWYDLSLRCTLEEPRARRIYFTRMYPGISVQTLSLHSKQLFRGMFDK